MPSSCDGSFWKVDPFPIDVIPSHLIAQIHRWLHRRRRSRRWSRDFFPRLNSLHPSLRFGLQTPRQDGFLPILDTAIRITSTGQLIHKLYVKKANKELLSTPSPPYLTALNEMLWKKKSNEQFAYSQTAPQANLHKTICTRNSTWTDTAERRSESIRNR